MFEVPVDFRKYGEDMFPMGLPLLVWFKALVAYIENDN